MKMTNKNKSRFLPVILLLVVVALLAIVLTPRLINQSKTAQTLSTDAKATRIAQLVEAMNTNKDAESQAHKDAYKEYCQLTARPENQRAKAVASIKEFLGDQAATVDFICSGFTGTDYANPISEHYNAKLGGFTIDPKTNNIVSVRAEAWEGSRWGTNPDGSRWFDPQAEYDYTPRYTQVQAQKVAEKFIEDHKSILGIDLASLKLDPEMTGMKDGGGSKINYFFGWRNSTGGSLSLTITNGGQVIVYSNELNGQAPR